APGGQPEVIHMPTARSVSTRTASKSKAKSASKAASKAKSASKAKAKPRAKSRAQAKPERARAVRSTPVRARAWPAADSPSLAVVGPAHAPGRPARQVCVLHHQVQRVTVLWAHWDWRGPGGSPHRQLRGYCRGGE